MLPFHSIPVWNVPCKDGRGVSLCSVSNYAQLLATLNARASDLLRGCKNPCCCLHLSCCYGLAVVVYVLLRLVNLHLLFASLLLLHPFSCWYLHQRQSIWQTRDSSLFPSFHSWGWHGEHGCGNTEHRGLKAKVLPWLLLQSLFFLNRRKCRVFKGLLIDTTHATTTLPFYSTFNSKEDGGNDST
jgi:hypothetical protein